MPVAYTKTGWVDGGPPPISAANLNKMEEQLRSPAVKEMVALPGAGGLYLDFAYGANGVKFLDSDPGSPHQPSSIIVGSSASIRYATDIVAGGMPAMLRFNNTAADVCCMLFTSKVYPQMTDHYDDFVLYVEGGPSQSVRLINWEQDSATKAMLRWRAADRKIEICDSVGTPNVYATTTNALAIGNFYRILTRNIHNGVTGTVQLWIYNFLTGALVETITSPVFDNGVYANSVRVGNVQNANLANIGYRIGGLALGCANDPGPYTPGRGAPIRIQLPNGRNVAEVASDGTIIVRATGTSYGRDLGPTPKFQYQAGDEVMRISAQGDVSFGPNRISGAPSEATNGTIFDGFFSGRMFRSFFASTNYFAVDDPPDETFTRAVSVPFATGLSASVLNNVISIGAGDAFEFKMRDRGKCMYLQFPSGATGAAGNKVFTLVGFNGSVKSAGLTVYVNGAYFTVATASGNTVTMAQAPAAGFSAVGAAWELHFNLGEIIGPLSASCLLTVPNLTGPIAWKLSHFPYPDLVTGNAGGSAVGQSRTVPLCFPHTRSGSSGATFTGPAAGVITGFNGTDDDIDRVLILNNDPSLGLFKVTAALGTAVTVTPAPPAMAGAAWTLSAKPTDGGGAHPGAQTALNGWKTAEDNRIFQQGGAARVYAPTQWYVSLMRSGHWYNPGVGGDITFACQSNGRVEALMPDGGIGYGLGAGGSTSQAAPVKTNPVTLDRMCGRIQMASESMVAGAIRVFTVNCAPVTQYDNVIINIRSGFAVPGSYRCWVENIIDGAFNVVIQNIDSVSHNDQPNLVFSIFRAKNA